MTCAYSASDRSLPTLIALAFTQLTHDLMDHLHRRGVNDVQLHHFLNVLRFVSYEGVTATDIARQAGVTQQAVSLAVADLENKGYVERTNDPRDARRRLIRWSPKGLTVASDVEQWFRDLEDSLRDSTGHTPVNGAITTLKMFLHSQETECDA